MFFTRLTKSPTSRWSRSKTTARGGVAWRKPVDTIRGVEFARFSPSYTFTVHRLILWICMATSKRTRWKILHAIDLQVKPGQCVSTPLTNRSRDTVKHLRTTIYMFQTYSRRNPTWPPTKRSEMNEQLNDGQRVVYDRERPAERQGVLRERPRRDGQDHVVFLPDVVVAGLEQRRSRGRAHGYSGRSIGRRQNGPLHLRSAVRDTHV